MGILTWCYSTVSHIVPIPGLWSLPSAGLTPQHSRKPMRVPSQTSRDASSSRERAEGILAFCRLREGASVMETMRLSN